MSFFLTWVLCWQFKFCFSFLLLLLFNRWICSLQKDNGEKYIKRKKMKHIVCRYITILLVKVTILTLVFTFRNMSNRSHLQSHWAHPLAFFCVLNSRILWGKWKSVFGDTITVYTRGLAEKYPTFICKMKTVVIRWRKLCSLSERVPWLSLNQAAFPLLEIFLEVLFKDLLESPRRFSLGLGLSVKEEHYLGFFRHLRDAACHKTPFNVASVKDKGFQEVFFWGNRDFLSLTRADFIS